ncbi:2-nitropropane dioxygenase-like protein [Lasiosphaeria miniovina]|uniref:2-nitropropane dioxygenase-like protein n=2 Tax=Lasiosphaeria TaxID=92901 RepID=A0AA39ZQH3_9PEZI|nr:2-nitropropane dioxygenase-like protein [Lasiosphaeria miniovina]KAK0701819.1 2-nitropropane dioxygenase-like protein [Lasiosphaeria miniovina]KAK3374416.1 2-nitropropane dioxygenase [Lasiosphaeria ovina]
MSSPQKIRTPLTDVFKINHPVMLAGMNVAAGPKLAAAVTNAGGIGVLGGINYTPEMLRDQIDELKEHLTDKKAPFGVDLLLPQVGGNARKTNYDYTKGKLNELVDIIIESGAKLFVSAVGVPPKHVVERFHKAGILYMNMIGHPKHVKKCLDLGCDIICAQGGEGGGHTGDVPTTVLIPAVVELCKNAKSPLTGKPVQVVAAGGIHNGQLLAAALMMGATGVWVGTRFVLSEEAGASESHKEAVRTAGFDDTIRTLIFTGRPLRVRKNPYIVNWETERQQEIRELTSQGKLPYEADLDKVMSGEMEPSAATKVAGSLNETNNAPAEEEDVDDLLDQFRPYLMGKCAAVCNDKKTAKEIVDEFVDDAAAWIKTGNSYVLKTAAKL